MITLEGVCKSFAQPGGRDVAALLDVDLKVRRGEFVTVIGSNGSGKSTLQNVIAGKYLPDSGTIMLDGRDITRTPEHKRAKYIGRVFQNPLAGTSPSMTIAENLRIAKLRGYWHHPWRGLTKVERAEYRAVLKEFRMGLEDRLDVLVGTLSGGQRQALTLLMATMQHPKLLLLDEHTAALDPKAAERLIHMTDQLVREHKLTTIMVTHSMSQALKLGTRTIMMHAGRIVNDYSRDERSFLKTSDLVDRFGELRRMEMLDEERLAALQKGYF